MSLPPVQSVATLLNKRFTSKRKTHLPSLIYMTDEKRDPNPIDVVERLPKGTWIVFRHYVHPVREALGHDLCRIARSKGLGFSVAGDVALALKLRADGIHLPAHQLSHGGPLHRHHPSLLISGAVHNTAEAVTARQAGLDFVLVGPVFATASHPGAEHLGKWGLIRLIRCFGGPVYGLGGISEKTAGRLKDLDLAGFAGIGFFST